MIRSFELNSRIDILHRLDVFLTQLILNVSSSTISLQTSLSIKCFRISFHKMADTVKHEYKGQLDVED